MGAPQDSDVFLDSQADEVPDSLRDLGEAPLRSSSPLP
jgi:hypothetical protein